MHSQELDALLEDAFWEGNSTVITKLPYETSDYSLLENVAQKIVDTLNLCVVSLDENEAIVKNILKILTDFIPTLKNDLEQSIVISECMLRIATEEIVPITILKCAVFNLNLLLDDDGLVLNWLQKEESLEGFLLILGRRLPSVGDFECQSCIFETLCKIVYGNENKHKWIQSWFSDDEKTRSMFLNWNLEQFAVESRKILNQINRRELNPRTYAFAATAVYFGNVQLNKLNGLEFWIDFNYDSESISFFCKDFELEDQDTSESWETVVIASDNVESYSVQKKKDVKSIELCITLNCSCHDLVVAPNSPFETNLVRMIFWIYVDVSSHLKAIFGDSETVVNDHTVNSQDTATIKKVCKISTSDVVKIHAEDYCDEKERRISDSAKLIHAEDYCDKKERRISDSAKLICLSGDVNNFDIANFVHKSHDSSQKRKASCSCVFLKESDSERSFQMNDKNKHAKFKLMKSNSNEKYSRNDEKFTNEEDGKNASRHGNMEHDSQIFRVRKSSDASCGIGFISDYSDILLIDTGDGEEGRFREISENLLKEKHEVLHEKHLDGLQKVSEVLIENETDEMRKSKTDILGQDVGTEESLSNGLTEKPLQPNKTETNLIFQDSQIIKNSNESVKLSQNDKKSISSEGIHISQKRIKKVDGSTKVSQETSDKNGENKFLENNFLTKGQIKDVEVKSSEQETTENEVHHSDKDAANIGQARKKRLKKNSDVVSKRKSSTSRLLKRKPNKVEREIISDQAAPKKQRKAAIKAMEKNKTILGQKEAEDVAKTFSEKSSNINPSNDEIEEVYSTPPTKPVKKRRFKSVFLTDTETGSSNVSWIGGRNSRLFESPEEIYSKRRKSKRASRSTSLKRTYKSTIGNSKKKENSIFSMGGFEIKSKSGLSDLENYELVVEAKTGHKKPSHLNRKPITFANVSKAVNAAVESCAEKLNIDNQLDIEPNNTNFDLRMYGKVPEYYDDGELQRNESIEKNLTNVSREDFKSNVTDESNTNQTQTKPSSLKRKHSSNSKFALQEKENSSNSEIHQKTVFNDILLSSSVKKRKTANLSALKGKAKRNRKDSYNTQYINLDTVTHTEDDFHAQDLLTFDETSLSILSAFTTQNPESPKILKTGQNKSSSIREKAIESHLHSSPTPNIGILTEQSLSSLGSDEAGYKKKHIKRFLTELSGESLSPNNFQHSDNFDQGFTSLSNKTSKSNKSSRSDNLLKHLTFENCLSEEMKISELSSTQNYIDVKKKKRFTSFEESNDKPKVSPEGSLQKFSLMDNYEVSGLQEEFLERCVKEDKHQETFKINGRKPSKQLSILHVLGVEMDNMTNRLLKTLQKRFHDFNIKITASREKILTTANALISKENDLGYKDLKNMAKASKVNRINSEKSLKKILLVGQEYFEAEKMHNHRMNRLHQKAIKKYAARIKLAGTYAVEALEDRAAAKTEVLLKNILKKIEYL